MKKKDLSKISITLSNKEQCEFTYTSLELATQHYNQLKSAGTLFGLWITSISLS